jgi:TolA-binding protein
MDTIGSSPADFIRGGISMTFDLERARGLRDFLQDDCAEVGDVWAEMIAEIERLRANGIAANHSELDLQLRIKELEADLEQSEICIQARLDVIDQQAARIKSLKKEIRRLKHESKVEQEFTNSYIKRLHDAEARIKELGSSLDEAEALTKQNAELMNGYLRRNAELEDALVEGLTNFLHYRASCYDPARRCPYAKECDDCSTWDACGHVEMFRSEARRQLQADGKIGPDAAKPQSWQITKEEKRALSIILEYISYDADDDIEICSHAAVLRAMLREAE